MQEEFPFAAIQATAPKRSYLRQFAEATMEHGPFVPQWMIADALGISRQAVHGLIKKGRLATVRIQDEEFVPLAVANAFVTMDRPTGRPRKQVLTR